MFSHCVRHNIPYYAISSSKTPTDIVTESLNCIGLANADLVYTIMVGSEPSHEVIVEMCNSKKSRAIEYLMKHYDYLTPDETYIRNRFRPLQGNATKEDAEIALIAKIADAIEEKKANDAIYYALILSYLPRNESKNDYTTIIGALTKRSLAPYIMSDIGIVRRALIFFILLEINGIVPTFKHIKKSNIDPAKLEN